MSVRSFPEYTDSYVKDVYRVCHALEADILCCSHARGRSSVVNQLRACVINLSRLRDILRRGLD